MRGPRLECPPASSRIRLRFHPGWVAEWLCSGLQLRVRRFDSDPSLHFPLLRAPGASLPRVLTAFLALWLLPAIACGDNTAGVFGPVVSPGQESLEYRAGFDPDRSDLIQRLHYQRPIGDGDDLRWRLVAQSRKTADGTLDFDFLQGELQWQLSDLAEGWHQAVRFDARVASDDRPGLVAFSYTQDRKINAQWAVRGLFLTALFVGNDAPSGLDLQARAHLRYQPDPALTLGLEWFSFFGRSADLPDFKDQTHQLGPFMGLRIGARWQLFASTLRGMTRGSDDWSFRLWLTRSL